MKRLLCLALLAVGPDAVSGSVASADSTNLAMTSDGSRPKIGLVLSGGGARGAAHIGVLEQIESAGIQIDYISGTSMGAIVGAFYAAGFSPAEIDEIVTSLNWRGAFDDKTPREDLSFRRKRDDDLFLIKSKPGLSDGTLKFPPGIVDGQNINSILQGLLINNGKAENFDQLQIPFRAVATDLVTGQRVVINDGSLAYALRASISIPAVLAPVYDGTRILVDGGVSSNLPIEVVRQMGAEIIIAVDVSSPLVDRDQLDSVIGVTEQLTSILTRANTEREIATLTSRDILLVPDLAGIGSLDFDAATAAIEKGRIAADQRRTDLERLGELSDDDAAYLARIRDASVPAPVIRKIVVDNNSLLADQVIETYLDVSIGQPLDADALANDIARIYGLELFSDVSYQVSGQSDAATLEVKVVEKPWGPNYLQFGAAISDNLEGENIFNLAAAYTQTAINPKGGEWRSIVQLGEDPGLLTELYQPLDFAGRYFVNPEIEYNKRNVNTFDMQGNIVAQFRETVTAASVFFGREFGTWGALSVGLRRSNGTEKVRIGDPTTPDQQFDGGDFLLRFAWDERDDFNFPRHGSWGLVQYLASRQSLGADSDFEQLMFNSGVAMSRGRNTLSLQAMFNTTIDNDAPTQNLFMLGGFGRLSGFQHDELSGQQAALVVANYRRLIGDFNLLPVYLGTTLEYGNTWQSKADIKWNSGIPAGSVYLGLDTFFGPVYLGYGLAEGGDDSAFFFLGQVF